MPKDEFVDEDPMGLVGMVMPGEPGQLEAMAECFVEEYVRMGWNEARLMTLFTNSMFMATHRIYCQKGEAYVMKIIQQTIAKWDFKVKTETRLHSIVPGEGLTVKPLVEGHQSESAL